MRENVNPGRPAVDAATVEAGLKYQVLKPQGPNHMAVRKACGMVEKLNGWQERSARAGSPAYLENRHRKERTTLRASYHVQTWIFYGTGGIPYE